VTVGESKGPVSDAGTTAGRATGPAVGACVVAFGDVSDRSGSSTRDSVHGTVPLWLLFTGGPERTVPLWLLFTGGSERTVPLWLFFAGGSERTVPFRRFWVDPFRAEPFWLGFAKRVEAVTAGSKGAVRPWRFDRLPATPSSVLPLATSALDSSDSVRTVMRPWSSKPIQSGQLRVGRRVIASTHRHRDGVESHGGE
jgi:hypothetical protein